MAHERIEAVALVCAVMTCLAGLARGEDVHSPRTFRVLDPETFTRAAGMPKAVVRTFSVRNPNTRYFVRIQNGGLAGALPKVSSANVSVNAIQVVAPADFNQRIAVIEKELTLASINEMAVEIASKPGAAVAIEIFGIDDEPPRIKATITPTPNAAGWNNTNVSVTFECTDSISGIAVCPEPVSVTTESAGHLVTGAAVDNAGNTTSTSVTVRLDRTPPRISRSWPPATEFGTDRTTVSVEGMFSDNLSGLRNANLRGPPGTIPLSVPGFAVVAELDTAIPVDEASRDNVFQIEVIDQADNRVQETFLVFHTLESSMAETDRTRTELSNGVLTSIDRALIQFQPNVTRDRIHEIIEEGGGRVAGFLVSLNMALGIFNTDRLDDLRQLLDLLETRPEIGSASPVFFPQLTQAAFDNDVLTAAERIAYTDIDLANAAANIINNNLSRSNVRVAVIDSGLNPDFGQSAEFAGIDFYDLCTRRGKEGRTGTPVDTLGHGSEVTGIIAAANNGAGNNGVIRNVPGAPVGVSVFRTECDNPSDGLLDGALTALAVELSQGGKVGNVSVVNMSFASSGQDARKQYRSFFNSDRGTNILWVASAGNGGDDEIGDQLDCGAAVSTLFFPAALACELPNVVSVAAHDPGTLFRSDFSNFGTSITLSAPGESVFAPNGVNRYGFFAGTSASAPLVTGAAALVLSIEPRIPSEVREFLAANTKVLADPTLPQGGLNLATLVTNSVLSKQRFEGFSSGGLVVFDANPPVEKPGLAGFLFDYVRQDHHIRHISIDYRSSNSGTVVYGDRNGDDDYNFSVDRQELPTQSTLDVAGGCAPIGGINQVVAPPGFVGVPVLVGFSVEYQNRDHHMDRFRVELFTDQFGQLELGVTCSDKNGDDDFCYTVAFALVPANQVRAAGVLSGSSSGGFQTKSYGGGVELRRPVLQGFTVDFSHDDHHLDQVGVRLDRTSASVFYNDKNDDDDFTWEIRWVDIN